MSEKVILIYTDLEGTLLREADREGDKKYDKNEFHAFLEQIDILQQRTGARVQIHIVSPVDETVMNKLIGQFDREIIEYNRSSNSGEHTEIHRIEAAAAYPMEDFTGMTSQGNSYMCRIDNRIMQLEKPFNKKDPNPAGYGKEKYVRFMTECIEERPWQEILMSIYCGNGRNDLLAMDYIRLQKGGIIICPKNSRKEVQAKSHHVSQEEDIVGITDGLKWVNKQIRDRQEANHDKNPKKTGEEGR